MSEFVRHGEPDGESVRRWVNLDLVTHVIHHVGAGVNLRLSNGEQVWVSLAEWDQMLEESRKNREARR